MGSKLVPVYVALSLLLAVSLLFYAFPHAPHYANQLLNASLVSGSLGANYSISSSNCTVSSYLKSSGVQSICTQAFNLTSNVRGKPSTLLVFVYRMNSSASAQSYVQRLTSDLNTTPWAPGATSEFSLLQRNGTNVYFTTMKIYSHVTYLTTTAYLLLNSTIIGATAEAVANETAYTSMQDNTVRLLYLLYNSTAAN